MSEQVQHMFGRIAGRYDLINRVLSGGSDLRWRKRALRLLHGRPERVLDLACGTFDLGLDALRLGKAERVHGGDFCLPMMQAGSDKRRDRPVSATVADALRLPFADASFDAVIMAYGWRNLDDPRGGVAEILRVLRPGGQLMILEFFRPTRLWPRLFYGTFGRTVMPLVGGMLSGDRSAYSYLNSSIQGFLSTKEAAETIRACGGESLRWAGCFGGVSHAVAADKKA